MNRRTALPLFIDLIALVLLWALAASWLKLPFLPNPWAVFTTLLSELQGGLIPHINASVWRIFVSVGIGTLVAAPLAVVAAQWPLLDRFLTPLLYFAYPAPKIVFLPLIILFLGLGNPSIIFLITLVIFFQVYVIVRDAAQQVPPETLDSVKSLGARRRHLLRYVYWPLTLPAILTALKISIGTAIAVLFISESIGNNVGLGYYIVVEQWGRFAYTKMYAGVLAMSILGLLMFTLLSALERYWTRWQTRP